jgi:hypothetical protein
VLYIFKEDKEINVVWKILAILANSSSFIGIIIMVFVPTTA